MGYNNKAFVLWLLLLSLLLAAAIGCSEKETNKRTSELKRDPGEYAGEYLLTPSAEQHRIILQKDGSVVSSTPTSREVGYLLRDSKMIRIYLNDRAEAVGLFLVDNYNPSDWRGMWHQSIRILRKTTAYK